MTSARGLLFVHDPYEEATGPGLRVWVSHRIRTKRELFVALARQLHFPSHFGGNWDALNDCLHDLSWLPDPEEIVLIHDGLPFGVGPSRSRRIYLELLAGLLEDDACGPSRWTLVFPTDVRDQVTRLSTSEG